MDGIVCRPHHLNIVIMRNMTKKKVKYKAINLKKGDISINFSWVGTFQALRLPVCLLVLQHTA